MKPYRVDFKYIIEEQASVYVIAAGPDEAKAGAEIMLGEGDNYTSLEVTSVEEYKRPTSPTVN